MDSTPIGGPIHESGGSGTMDGLIQRIRNAKTLARLAMWDLNSVHAHSGAFPPADLLSLQQHLEQLLKQLENI